MAGSCSHPSLFSSLSSTRADAPRTSFPVPVLAISRWRNPNFKPIAEFLPFRISGKSRSRILALETAAPHVVDGPEDAGINGKEKESEPGVPAMLPTMETLLKSYRKAVSENDEKAVEELESSAYAIEEAKNEAERSVAAMSGEMRLAREKYLRLQADFDNFRKRHESERAGVRAEAEAAVVTSFLGIVDGFERAKQHIKPETDGEGRIDTSYRGIYKQLEEAMKAMGIGLVVTVGTRFDPSVHEAIAREESVEFVEGVVVEEFRRGFVLRGGRLLRPAMVKVSAGPGPGTVESEFTGVNAVEQSVDVEALKC